MDYTSSLHHHVALASTCPWTTSGTTMGSWTNILASSTRTICFEDGGTNLDSTRQQLRKLPSAGLHLQEPRGGYQHLGRLDPECWNTMNLDHRHSDHRQSTSTISMRRSSTPRQLSFFFHLLVHLSTFSMLPRQTGGYGRA